MRRHQTRVAFPEGGNGFSVMKRADFPPPIFLKNLSFYGGNGILRFSLFYNIKHDSFKIKPYVIYDSMDLFMMSLLCIEYDI